MVPVSVEMSGNQRSCTQTTLLNPWGTSLTFSIPSTGLRESPSPCVKGPTLWRNCWPSASSKQRPEVTFAVLPVPAPDRYLTYRAMARVALLLRPLWTGSPSSSHKPQPGDVLGQHDPVTGFLLCSAGQIQSGPASHQTPWQSQFSLLQDCGHTVHYRLRTLQEA